MVSVAVLNASRPEARAHDEEGVTQGYDGYEALLIWKMELRSDENPCLATHQYPRPGGRSVCALGHNCLILKTVKDRQRQRSL
jgi:hypothetical protein